MAPPMYGLANYLPPQPEGEDSESIKLHREWLQDEKKSRRRSDRGQVDRRMLLTFSERRDLVVNKSISVDELLEEYPWLEELDQVINPYFDGAQKTTLIFRCHCSQLYHPPEY